MSVILQGQNPLVSLQRLSALSQVILEPLCSATGNSMGTATGAARAGPPAVPWAVTKAGSGRAAFPWFGGTGGGQAGGQCQLPAVPCSGQLLGWLSLLSRPRTAHTLLPVASCNCFLLLHAELFI